MTDTTDADFGLRDYFEGSLDLYCELTPEGIFIYANSAWEKKLGYLPNEIIGKNFAEFLHPGDIIKSNETYRHRDPPDKGFFRNRYRHKDGSYVTLMWSGHLAPHRKSTYAHARDVTNEVRKAMLLEHVAAIQDTYMNHGTNKRGLLDQVLKEIVEATESEYGFIGEIRENILSGTRFLSPYATTAGFENQNLAALSESSIESGAAVVNNNPQSFPRPLQKSEAPLNAFVSIPLYYLGEYIGLFGIAKCYGRYDADVVDKLKTLVEATASVVGLYQASFRENALRERFMVIVENLPIMLTEYDSKGRITWANKFYRERIGLTENEIAVDDIRDRSMADDEEAKRAIKFMLSGRTDWEDFNLRSSTGQVFPSTWTNVRLKDGRAIGIGQDLTDRRLAESKMIQSSKMASLGEMSAGVSHEINNPLAIIQGSAFRAIQNLSDAANRRDEVEGDLNRIIQNCDRIARIVRGLRAFSRSVEHEPFMPTPLATVVEDVLNLAHERFKSQNISLHIELGAPAIIDCRPVQLGQVLMNLLNNAFDAVSEGPKTSRDIWVHAKVVGENIQIAVEDSGVGIPKAVQERILEPFFTTKAVGKGTGLGLSISKGIIESHNGRLWLDTQSKKTRFVIEIPIRQSVES